MMCQSICFSRHWSPCYFSRCWPHKLTFYFVVFKMIFLFFSQTQLAMQLPAKKTRAAAQLAMQFHAEKNPGCSTGFECVISHWLTRSSVRTVGQSDASDVIIKPKFIALMGLPISLSYGAPRARTFGARGAPLLMLTFGSNLCLSV